jgi:hypothetical protein
MEFLRGPTLPVPFNIIPMPSLIVRVFKKVFFCFFKDDEDGEDDDIDMPVMNGGPNGHAGVILFY